MTPVTSRGFTLIELMVVVAIIGILASIAYPSYTEYIRQARRVDAQSFLMNLANRQQQFFLDSRGYAGSVSTLGTSIPTSVSSYYTIDAPTIDNGATPPTFTISAVPSGDQAKDKCGTMSISQTGAKTPTTSGCW